MTFRRSGAALAAALSLCTTGEAQTPPVTPLRWILNGPALSTFASDPFAQRFFSHANPFVIQRKDGAVSLPPEWGALPVRTFTSYAAILRAFESGGIGSDVSAVLYDNEAWQFTPRAEQADPASYTRSAAHLAHTHGLLFIAAPAVDLTRALAPGSEKRYDAYLRLGLAADAARYADVYEIQAQGSERDTNKYAAFVKAAAAQARAANPKVVVLAGISTNPSGQHVSADDILRGIDATRKSLNGYWFNVPMPGPYCPACNDFRPDIAIEVLRRLNPR